jgi:hypothetical protein
MVNGKADPTVELDQVWFAFDCWRRQRGGKGRIPERPWGKGHQCSRKPWDCGCFTRSRAGFHSIEDAGFQGGL